MPAARLRSMFAKMGIKALIIEGMPKDLDKWYSIAVNKDGATISEETELIGKGNFAVVEALQARLGKKIGIITLGPAGEMKMLIANISVKDPESQIRSHGRGGVGAVMGSKKIKFISIDDTGRLPASRSPIRRSSRCRRRCSAKALIDHPVSGQGLPTYGTAVLVNILNEAGGLPTGISPPASTRSRRRSPAKPCMTGIIERRGKPKHGCHAGCLIQCSQIYNDKDGKYLTSGFRVRDGLGTRRELPCMQELDDIARSRQHHGRPRSGLHRDLRYVRRSDGSRRSALRRWQGRGPHAERRNRQGNSARPHPGRRHRNTSVRLTA